MKVAKWLPSAPWSSESSNEGLGSFECPERASLTRFRQWTNVISEEAMTTERSDSLYHKWRESTEKFDYFMLGVLGALCAYLAQSYKPSQVGFNPGTLELLALLTLVLGAVTGFRRIEATNLVTRLSHQSLYANESRGAMVSVIQNGPGVNTQTGQSYTPESALQETERLSQQLRVLTQQLELVKAQALRRYHLRNSLALIGFLMLLAAKLAGAYM